MKKVYKNAIFTYLLSHPLGLNNFELKEDDTVLQIMYLPFNGLFKYHFIQDPNTFDKFSTSYIVYAPNFPARRSYDVQSVNFNTAFSNFQNWLRVAVEEYINDEKEIDLFEEYQKQSNIAAINEEEYSHLTEFTDGEKKSIQAGLNEIKLLIASRFQATEEQLTVVHNRIDYLVTAVDRLNKIDFKGIFINTIIAIMIALNLDTAKGHELYNLFMQIIQFTPILPK